MCVCVFLWGVGETGEGRKTNSLKFSFFKLSSAFRNQDKMEIYTCIFFRLLKTCE